MQLKELDSFKLSDAIKFHDHLNPNIWNDDKLLPEVKDQLLVIAQDFITELGVKDLHVKDITISGSNSAYSYTEHSDLDLHILVDFNKLSNDEIYLELFDTKKTIYNDTHDIKIHGIPVELYVQDSNQPVVSLGEYSVLHDKWIKFPNKKPATLDQNNTKLKYEKLLKLIKLAIKSKDYDKIDNTIKTIKRYRKAGLSKGGEFSPENLSFKLLRNQGYIKKIYNLRGKIHSKDLSIDETVNPSVFKQGFEKTKPILNGKYVLIAKNGRILYHQKPHEPSDQFRIEVKTKKGELVGWVNFENVNDNLEALDLNVLPAYRRQGIATEIYKFAKELGNTIKPSDKQTKLGKMMWQGFDKKETFAEASGYIPSEKEKNDPRFKTALTVDIKPDSIKQNARKLGSKISRAGIPPLLKP